MKSCLSVHKQANLHWSTWNLLSSNPLQPRIFKFINSNFQWVPTVSQNRNVTITAIGKIGLSRTIILEYLSWLIIADNRSPPLLVYFKNYKNNKNLVGFIVWMASISSAFLCACGTSFSVEHVLSCPKGGLPSLWHNEIRDLTAQSIYTSMAMFLKLLSSA